MYTTEIATVCGVVVRKYFLFDEFLASRYHEDMNWLDKHNQQFAAALGFLVFSLFVSYYHYPAPEPLPKAVALNSLEPVKTSDPNITPHFDPSLIISTTTFSTPLLTPKTTEKIPSVSSTRKPQESPKKHITIVPLPTPAKPPIVTPRTVAVAPQAEVTAQVVEPITPTPAAVETDSLQPLRRSLVNILCTAHKSPLRGSTGSGVIIDSHGIILTVAHVAESQLLSETLGPQAISCVIRTGNPANCSLQPDPSRKFVLRPRIRDLVDLQASTREPAIPSNEIASLILHRHPQKLPQIRNR